MKYEISEKQEKHQKLGSEWVQTSDNSILMSFF